MRSPPQKHAGFTTRLGRVITFFVLAVVVVTFLVAHVLAWRWTIEPFLGLLLDPTLVLSTLQGRGWARLQCDPPLEQPDRLIAVDEQPVERYADVEAVLSEHAVGDTVWVLVERPDGNMREEQITLAPFPLKDLFLIFIVPYLVGMAYLSIGIWVYWVQGWGRTGQVFTGMCAAFALILCGIFDISSTHRLPVLWGVAVPFTAATAMHLAMVFPQEPRFVRRVPVLRLLPYLPATFLALCSAFSVYDVSQPWAYIPHWRNSYLFAAVGIFFLLGMLAYRMIRPPSPLIRQQSRVILLGAMLAFLPVVPWLLLNVLGQPVPFLTPFYTPLFAIFPLSIAYAILRYRLMEIDQLLSRGLAYGALTFLIVAAYFALINGMGHFFAVKTSDPILLSLFVLALVLLFNPLRNRAQRLVDRVFFREPADYRVMLQDLNRELAQTLYLDGVLADDVFNSVASGVITTDAQDKVALANRAAEVILDIRADEVIGHPCQEVLQSLGDSLQPLVRLVKRGEAPMIAYKVQPDLPTRGPVWLRVNLSPLKDSHGVIAGVIIVVDDLTERR